MFTHRIVIGDWSNDGHGKAEFFSFECSHDEPEIKRAYNKAVKKSKVALHDNGGRLRGATAVCCHYEESAIEPKELKALKDLGVDFSWTASIFDEEEGLGCCPQDIAYLFFAMVKTQLPEFEYKLVPEKKPINGFWSKDFNHGFGYGSFQ